MSYDPRAEAWSGLDLWNRIGTARLAVVHESRLPYYSQMLFEMTVRLVKGLPTEATTKEGLLLIGPERWEKITYHSGEFGIAHEVSHQVLDTFGRGDAIGADPDLFGYAHDLVINSMLVMLGFTKDDSDPVLSDHGLSDDMAVEEAYAALVKQGVKVPKGPRCAMCGSGAGTPVPGEPKPGPGEGRARAELNAVRKSIAEEIKRKSQGYGSMPAELARFAEITLGPPKVRWEEHFRRHARAAIDFRRGVGDHSWVWPSRRQGALGYGVGVPIMAGSRTPIPHAAVFFDTSGSMSADELGLGLREINAMFASMHAEVIFASCDCTIHSTGRARNIKQIQEMLSGGGGTDFRPCFEWMAQQKPKPTLAIFITDGCGPYPAEPPKGTHTIWLITGSYTQTPPWGTVIEIES